MSKPSVFRSKNQTLAERAIEILQEEQPMTLRGLYYRLVSASALKNQQSEYKRLGSVASRLREDGRVPFDWIVDNVRDTLKPSSWSGLGDFGNTVCQAYRKDFWASLDHHVEVFIEKDAMAGVVHPVTQEYDVSLHVCRGYASISFAGVIASQWNRIEKPIFAYYLGDFDPSGFDLERDLREKLERYSDRDCLDQDDADLNGHDTFCWIRLGVTAADFAQHNLIKLPVKLKDKRAKGFIEEHGVDCAEVDALPPSEIRRRVQAAIESHIDPERWNRLLAVEQVERNSVATYMRSFGSGKLNLDSISPNDEW
jgi:hypothetical protein